MFSATRGTDKGEVVVGILQLRVVGEDFINKERNRIAIIVASNGVA